MNIVYQPFALKEMWKAQKRIRSIVEETPLVYSDALSRRLNKQVYLKLEQTHPTGSFKIRGAANKLLSLSESDRKKGVTTFSTGNHGISVAYVAEQLGMTCVVCLSDRVPKEKLNRLKRLGARVEIVGQNQDDAEAYCYQLAKEEGLTIVKPFDDADIIAGQGTIGLEIMQQCPDVQHVIIPLSGGGLLSGIGYILKSIDPNIKITGVSPQRSAVMYESLKKGQPIEMKEEHTLADSLLGGIGIDNRYTFPMTKAYMDQGRKVSERSIRDGVLFMLEYHKMAVEGAAGAGVGLLLEEKEKCDDPVIIVISGNNIDHETISELVVEPVR
ncbi:pyridoxal-phosphate dependent enzyme [Halobacillus yeomjeoni]|uniref:threonine ammonia-lyase n=1 Tax=Halobacillus yeomjeoni TaxID=311194 RepID=A0A931HV54_9BACI|nr:pyridoxal-phosphate dependent enzyme [Halobacillus yeomjeoni]MBH0230360.1 pyridoxal-phosphate dependent enzyme [Halobacillus yeomjeoni]